MIRAENFRSNHVVANIRIHESFGHDKIIQSPTHIFGSCAHHVRPKCVTLLLIRIKMAKRVHKALLQKTGEA